MSVYKCFFFSLLILLVACNGNDSKVAPVTNDVAVGGNINFSVKNIFPHDTNSFTEGFLFHDMQLYESTGAPEDMPQTRSAFGTVDLKTGRMQVKVEIDKVKYFGEGIAFLGNKVYQLTYKNRLCLFYDSKSFKKLGAFPIPVSEGWGLTTNGQNLVMSDGTNRITMLDTENLNVYKNIYVLDENGPVQNINELEYIHGAIYANIYGTNSIIKIDPSTGNVIGKLDLTSLVDEIKTKYPKSMEMNGIAYDSISNSVFITGKMWPSIYELDITHTK